MPMKPMAYSVAYELELRPYGISRTRATSRSFCAYSLFLEAERRAWMRVTPLDRISFQDDHRPTFTLRYSGANILVDNLGIEPTGTYAPLAEIAYCAEYVDTEVTPEYLYSDRYTLEVGSEFGSYSGVVDHLQNQGHRVGPEMKAYFDAYIAGLAHSPCYAEVVREPPANYEHFPPLRLV